MSAWRQRIIDMGEGARTDIEPQAALEIARNGEPDMTPPPAAITDTKLTIGSRVSIKPDDYGQEVTIGEVVWVSDDEIALKRDDDTVGTVLVHYPRLGYVISAAD